MRNENIWMNLMTRNGFGICISMLYQPLNELNTIL